MNDARESSRRLADLLHRERGALTDFLLALAEFDRSRLWVQLGHANLFDFLHRELGLSRGAAHYRKVAAHLVQRYPEMVEPLREGKLCITVVLELARVITPENSAVVLPQFFHRSKQEAKAIAVGISPAAVIPRREVVTEVSRSTGVQPVEREGTHLVQGAAPTAPMQLEPLTPGLRRLHMTVSKQFIDKLDAARRGQGHAQPGASAEKVIEAALDLLLAQQAKRRAEVKRPQKNPRPAKKPGHVPAAVKRAVWSRDDGKCTWPLDSGGICGSTLRLEIDHVVPRGRGGASTVDGCRLLCAAHNQLAARQVYGDDWMDQFTDRVQVKAPIAREDAASWIYPQPSRTFASSSASRLRSSRSFVKRAVTSRMMAEAPTMAPASSRTSWMVNSMESGDPSLRDAGTARMSWP